MVFESEFSNLQDDDVSHEIFKKYFFVRPYGDCSSTKSQPSVRF